LASVTGVLLALVAVRLSGLLLTMMTLTFALFADQFLFQYSWSGGGLSGVNIPRPLLGPLNFSGDRSFLVLVFVVLAAVSGLVILVQRGTTGRYLAAIRGSQTAAESLGISLTRARLQVFALSAGIAGLGGALYGMLYHSVTADTFPYEFSLVFAVVVITTGSRTVEGAIQSGMAYAIFQLVLSLYLPQRIQGIEPILFAVGAMTYAVHPEGIVEFQKTKWMRRINRLLAAYDQRRGRRTGAIAGVTPMVDAPGIPAGIGDGLRG
jgi:ABC-type branched-subunit amino acid transport system permease subunit